MALIHPKQINRLDKKRYGKIEHFLGTSTSGSIIPGTVTASGTGAAASILSPAISGKPGVLRLATGTTLTGYCNWRSPASIAFGNDVYVLRARFRVPVLPTATNYSVHHIGFGTGYSGAPEDALDSGIYLYLDPDAYYLVFRRSGGTSVYPATLTQAAIANGWNDLEIVVNGTTRIATFTLNAETIEITNQSVNFPTDGVSLVASIIKYTSGTGTASRTFDIDFMDFGCKLL